jgi:hypothetical protein
VAPRYSFLSDGRLQVESKTQMRARGLPSTDYADALCMTFASAGLGVTSGTMNASLWSQMPVRDRILGME